MNNFIKKIILSFIFLSCTLTMFSQHSSLNRIQERIDNCKEKVAELTNKRQKDKAKYENQLNEYAKGKYCSLCSRSASQIEREESVSFQKHLNDVSGKSIPYSKAQLNQKRNEYNDKLKDLSNQRDAQYARCDKLYDDLMAEENRIKEEAAAEAKRQAEEEAKRQAEEEAAAEAKRQAEEEAAAEAERQAEEEAAEEAERRAEEERREEERRIEEERREEERRQEAEELERRLEETRVEMRDEAELSRSDALNKLYERPSNPVRNYKNENTRQIDEMMSDNDDYIDLDHLDQEVNDLKEFSNSDDWNMDSDDLKKSEKVSSYVDEKYFSEDLDNFSLELDEDNNDFNSSLPIEISENIMGKMKSGFISFKEGVSDAVETISLRKGLEMANEAAGNLNNYTNRVLGNSFVRTAKRAKTIYGTLKHVAVDGPGALFSTATEEIENIFSFEEYEEKNDLERFLGNVPDRINDDGAKVMQY